MARHKQHTQGVEFGRPVARLRRATVQLPIKLTKNDLRRAQGTAPAPKPVIPKGKHEGKRGTHPTRSVIHTLDNPSMASKPVRKPRDEWRAIVPVEVQYECRCGAPACPGYGTRIDSKTLRFTGIEPKSGAWRCGNCGMENSRRRKHCVECTPATRGIPPLLEPCLIPGQERLGTSERTLDSKPKLSKRARQKAVRRGY